MDNTAQLNLLWASLILEELSRLGVQHLCLAPGSRSTPLTLAACEQTKLTQHHHFDERGLGFFALGLAKASNAPVAIITTSGTAVANLYPAIIEASITQTPLIVLSGDRPEELIGCGANQAIEQVAIFGHYADSINLPAPNLATPAAALLSKFDTVISNADNPIHINCIYREPLYSNESLNIDTNGEFSDYLQGVSQWRRGDRPLIDIANNSSSHSQLPTQDAINRFMHGKGVIVVGRLTEVEQPEHLVELSKKLGWPLLCDAQSQLRQDSGVITHIDQLLHTAKAQTILAQATRVLFFGGRLVSKRLIELLAKHHWQHYWQVLPKQLSLDPSHSAKQLWISSITKFTALNWPSSSSAGWAAQLTQQNSTLETLFEQQITDGEFGEAQVLRSIAKKQQPKQQLFIGNSLPIRLYDMFAPITDSYGITYTNRGASGIDGLLATACGIASHKGLPTSLVIGDLSQLHDLNSLALAKQCSTPLVIVIFNNNGGNIFNLLPVPTEQQRASHYRLAHDLEFGYGAAMFDIPYSQVDDIDTFDEVYHEFIQHPGATVIEVSISQHQASDQIQRLTQWIKES